MRIPSLPLLIFLTFPVYAAPSIGAVRATPTTAVIDTPTQITVTASVTDPSLIPGGVNLLELNANGTTTILGTLHDDGLNGDAYAGDGVLTLLVTLKAASASQIQLQISAAFRGLLLRVKGPIMNVFFQPANAPQLSIAALAQYLQAGNTAAALNYVVPSESATITALNQESMSTLASMLNSAILVASQNDFRIFQSSFVTPLGTTTAVELSMIPGPNGQWLINSW
jgi:hypothetical protein